MKFTVSHKGIMQFSGSLGFVMRFIEEKWGSATQAYELGVKVIQMPVLR